VKSVEDLHYIVIVLCDLDCGCYTTSAEWFVISGIWGCHELAEEGWSRQPDSCRGRCIEVCSSAVAGPILPYW